MAIVSQQRGAAYVLALATLLVGITLALAALRSSGAYFLAQDSRVKSEAARNLAEAGIEYAYWQVHHQQCALPYTADVTLPGGQFHVEAVDNGFAVGSSMLITSTGTAGSTTFISKRVVLGLLPYDYAWCEDSDISTNEKITCTYGTRGLRTNGSVDLSNPANDISTGVWAKNGFSFTQGTINPKYSGVPPIHFPEIDIGYYTDMADFTFWSNTELPIRNLPPAPALVVVSGDLKLKGPGGSYDGKYLFVASGVIEVEGSMTATPGSALGLISQSRIVLKGGCNTLHALCYAHNYSGTALIDIGDSIIITGTIAADHIVIDDDVTLIRRPEIVSLLRRSFKLPGQ